MTFRSKRAINTQTGDTHTHLSTHNEICIHHVKMGLFPRVMNKRVAEERAKTGEDLDVGGGLCGFKQVKDS